MELNELCLEITNKCPMNCIHCSAEAGNPLKDEMNLPQMRNTIREFSILGGKVLEISGGEPLAHDNIFEIIRYAKDEGLETRLYTSGFLLTNRKIDELISSGLDKIIFNLQGSNQDIHEKITLTKGSFNKAVVGIKKAMSKGFWVGVHFVPMKPNIDDLENMADLCADLNVSEFAILRFVPQGRGLINKDILELSRAENKCLEGTIFELKNKARIKTRVGRPFNILYTRCHLTTETKKCNAGIDKCLIKPNGELAPCPAFKQNNDYVMGNVTRETMKTIWRDSIRWMEFRKFDFKNLTPPCSGCMKVRACRGGCVAQRALAWENIDQGPDPACTLPINLQEEALKTKESVFAEAIR